MEEIEPITHVFKLTPEESKAFNREFYKKPSPEKKKMIKESEGLVEYYRTKWGKRP